MSAGYPETMGLRLSAGVGFSRDPGPAPPIEVLVNEAAARRFWPGEDPLGKEFVWGYQVEGEGPDRQYQEPVPLRVVGVTDFVKTEGLAMAPVPQVHMNSHPGGSMRRNQWIVVRAAGDPSRTLALVRDAIVSVDPSEIEVTEVRSMDDVVREAGAESRFYVFLAGSLAGAALVLVLAGLWGVLSFLVAGRRHEMGVRRTLGAPARDLQLRILRYGMVPVLAGIGVGAVGGLLGGRLLSAHLFGVEVSDPLTMAAVTLCVGGLGALACWHPARRASAVDPAESLRAE